MGDNDDDERLWIRPGLAKKLESSRRKGAPPAEKNVDSQEDKNARPDRSEGRRSAPANPGRLFGQSLQRSTPKPVVEASPREPEPDAGVADSRTAEAPSRVQGRMRGWDGDETSDARDDRGTQSYAGRGHGAPWKSDDSGWHGPTWRDGWESNMWDSRGWSNS